MAVIFLDSSALVKRYVPEAGSAWVKDITDPANGNRLYVARVTGVEVVAAITRRQRRGDITPHEAASALADFRRDFPAAVLVVEITPDVVARAMDLAERHGLRGYDAVQLAAASGLHAQSLLLGLPGPLIVTSDRDLNAAATIAGLVIDNPDEHV